MKDKIFLDTNILIYFYSNDLVMHHEQIIVERLKIVNPFINI